MDDKSVEKTCFTTKFGNFVFKVMSFSFCNAHSTFQRKMNKILYDFIDVAVYVFIDNVLIYFNSIIDHMIHLNLVLDIFEKFHLKISIEKYQFMRDVI